MFEPPLHTAIGAVVAFLVLGGFSWFSYRFGWQNGYVHRLRVTELRAKHGAYTGSEDEKGKSKAPTPEKTFCTGYSTCEAFSSPTCSDGRCRFHCQMQCMCEKQVDLIADGVIRKAIDRIEVGRRTKR